MATSHSGTKAPASSIRASSIRASSIRDAGPVPQFDTRRNVEHVILFAFIAIRFLAILAAVPLAWNRGLGWHDVVIASVMYLVAGHGITVGYHRCFTHGSFKPNRPLKIAAAWSMAIEGPVLRSVADHRRHHAFSDREGDPHSPCGTARASRPC